MTNVSKELKNKYDKHYSDKTEEWRKLGATGKAENIINVAEEFSFNKVLDVGAGDGNILSLLSERKFATSYTAAEISDSAIEQIKKKNIEGLVKVVQFDGYELPFADDEFELAISSHVIEHVEFPRKLLREIKRVSKHQILEVPIDFSFSVDKKFDHFNSYGHINIYTPALFNFLLYTEKFKVLNCKHALYKKEIVDFQTKTFTVKYLIVMIKRLLWRIFPILMKLKPNTYTVLTE